MQSLTIFNGMGVCPHVLLLSGGTPEELKAHIAGEIVKWKAVRERAGIEQEQ